MNLKDLESFFDNYEFKGKIQLDQCTLLQNPKLFVKTHLNALKSNSGNRLYKPYYDRLIKLHKLLTQGGN